MALNREELDTARRESADLMRLVKPLLRPFEEWKGQPVLIELDETISTLQAVLLLSRPREGLTMDDEAMSLAAWRATCTVDVLAAEGFGVAVPAFSGHPYVVALRLSAWALGHIAQQACANAGVEPSLMDEILRLTPEL